MTTPTHSIHFTQLTAEEKMAWMDFFLSTRFVVTKCPYRYTPSNRFQHAPVRLYMSGRCHRSPFHERTYTYDSDMIHELLDWLCNADAIYIGYGKDRKVFSSLDALKQEFTS